MKKPSMSLPFGSSAGASGQADPPQLLSLAVVRPDDLLALVFHLVNIDVADNPTAGASGAGSRKQLVPASAQLAIGQPGGAPGAIGQLAGRQVAGRLPATPQPPGPPPMYIIVEFPSQSVGEQSFFEVNGKGEPVPKPDPNRPTKRKLEPPTMPAQARYSGPSWLVFQIPPAKLPIPFELDALLQLCMDAPQVVQSSKGNPVAPEQLLLPHAAFKNQDCEYALPSGTAIEAPFRLYLSPSDGTSWQHATAPQTTTGDGQKTQDTAHSHRSVLWHTRLQGASGSGPTARAVWNADHSRRRLFIPPHFSLEPNDRDQLVGLTTMPLADLRSVGGKRSPIRVRLAGLRPSAGVARSGLGATAAGALAGQLGYAFPPVDVEQLFLSAMGAWLKAHWASGTDDLPQPYDIVRWDHEMSMGRDQFVRVVRAGSLLPFGHRAVLVTITQRRFEQDSKRKDHTAAFLKTHQFIVVLDPSMAYDRAVFPFKRVVCKTLVTPNILQGTLGTVPGNAFWVQVPDPGTGGITDLPFHLEATDKDGQVVEFTAPLVFVEDTTPMSAAVAAYQQDGHAGRRDGRNTVRSFGGAAISFVEARKDVGDGGRLETQDITFGADVVPDRDARPPFQPRLLDATVTTPAVKRLTGNTRGVIVQWEDKFVAHGGNAGDVFFRQAVPTRDTTLGFGDATRSGGLLKPNLAINGFSRLLGPVSLPTSPTAPSLVDGHFSPADLLQGLNLKILGSIDLSTIMSTVTPNFTQQAAHLAQRAQQLAQQAQSAAQQAQNVAQQAQDAAADPGELLPALIGDPNTTHFTWQSESFNSVGIFQSKASDGAPGTHFRLEAVIFHPPGQAPSFRTTGVLTSFAVALPSTDPAKTLVALPFKSFTFCAQSGQKVDVSVNLGSLQFSNSLSFVQTLLDILPLDGFLDPPSIDVAPDHLTAGFSLAVPTIPMGYFTLQNVSLGASLYVPFLSEGSDDEAGLDLDFCTRDKPFMLTVSFLGGGGFFGMRTGLSGIQMVEMALDFGASAAVDLGVASGSLTVVGGVYFQLAGSGAAADLTLTAFVRSNGELDVLGLIKASINLYIGLTYQSEGSTHVLAGDAELDISVSIAFFSQTVSIHVHREFKGSDPTFLDTYSAADWQEYCEAFAG